MSKVKREVPRNWTVVEAVDAIVTNNDLNEIFDIGRKHPLALNLMARLAAKAGPEMEQLLSAFPEHITMRKIEGALKEMMESELAKEEVKEEKKEEKPEAKKEEKKETKKRGRRKTKKEEEPVEEVVDEEEVEEEVEEEEKDYSEMTAPQLYKLAKSRGLKVKARQKADYYVELLEEADSVGEVEEEEDEDDDWDI